MADRSAPAHVHVAIAGSGFGGLGTAIRLAQSGMHDFLVFERSDDLGGVWRDNTYPGCACDVESHLYSFSFARNFTFKRRVEAFDPSEYVVMARRARKNVESVKNVTDKTPLEAVHA